MSPRAAWRLERMGFEAYDYVAGKADWISAGWDTERSPDSPRTARDALVRDFEQCGPGDDAAPLASRVVESGNVHVVNEEGILLGRVGHHELHEIPEGATAEEVMHPGPATVRPFEPLEPLLERMSQAGVEEIVVSTKEGRVLGFVRREAD